MTYEAIKYEKNEGYAVITLTQPKSMNALGNMRMPVRLPLMRPLKVLHPGEVRKINIKFH